MAAGELRNRITVKSASGYAPTAQIIATLWAKVTPPKSSGPADGLRSSQSTTITIYRNAAIQAGMWIVSGSRLYIIDATEDAGRGMMTLSCVELIGRAAIYTPAESEPYSIRAAVGMTVPYAGEYTRIPDERYVIEVPKIELQAEPARDDTLTIAGTTYTVEGLAALGDDGVILRLVAT